MPFDFNSVNLPELNVKKSIYAKCDEDGGIIIVNKTLYLDGSDFIKKLPLNRVQVIPLARFLYETYLK